MPAVENRAAEPTRAAEVRIKAEGEVKEIRTITGGEPTQALAGKEEGAVVTTVAMEKAAREAENIVTNPYLHTSSAFTVMATTT